MTMAEVSAGWPALRAELLASEDAVTVSRYMVPGNGPVGAHGDAVAFWVQLHRHRTQLAHEAVAWQAQYNLNRDDLAVLCPAAEVGPVAVGGGTLLGMRLWPVQAPIRWQVVRLDGMPQ